MLMHLQNINCILNVAELFMKINQLLDSFSGTVILCNGQFI